MENEISSRFKSNFGDYVNKNLGYFRLGEIAATQGVIEL